jgi:phage FluMu protein Com
MHANAQDLAKIGQQGFRKWYEARLVEAHVWLVTAFLCLIMLTIGLELLSTREQTFNIVSKAALIALGAWFGWLAFKRYSHAMLLAEAMGERAVCPSCKQLNFAVTRHSLPGDENGKSSSKHDLNQDGLLVNCRKCQHQWRWGYLP